MNCQSQILQSFRPAFEKSAVSYLFIYFNANILAAATVEEGKSVDSIKTAIKLIRYYYDKNKPAQ